MKKIILLFFLLLLSCILFYSYKSISKKNDIDFLEVATENIRNTSLETPNVYYFSNSKSPALFFKTQFVLAPKVINQEAYTKIPEGAYILMVIDKNIKNAKVISSEKINLKDTLVKALDNDYYKAILLKK
tara:strand:- start:41776 stop:42165 length:390 start_codon:yes stop_codon:yes gene_type:complete